MSYWWASFLRREHKLLKSFTLIQYYLPVTKVLWKISNPIWRLAVVFYWTILHSAETFYKTLKPLGSCGWKLLILSVHVIEFCIVPLKKSVYFCPLCFMSLSGQNCKWASAFVKFEDRIKSAEKLKPTKNNLTLSRSGSSLCRENCWAQVLDYLTTQTTRFLELL